VKDDDGFWPVTDRGELHLRYPKIWEIGALASTAERTMGLYLDGIRDNAEYGALGVDYANKTAAIFAHLFSMDYQMAAFEPIIEVYGFNQNRFTGRAIETPAMEGVEPFARYNAYTSRSMVRLGELTKDMPPELQISPARAEALIRGYFNTFGMYGLMLADSAFFSDEMPARKFADYPVVRNFTESSPPKHTRFETEFWAFAREASMLHNTIKDMEKKNRPDIADEKMAEPLAPMGPIVERIRKDVRDITNQQILVMQSADFTPIEKRTLYDDLQRQKQAYLKEFYNEAVKQ
jgi:hypothetical protein